MFRFVKRGFQLCNTNLNQLKQIYRSKSNVETEKLGSIFIVAINRPEHRNAVDPPTAKLLYDAFKTFEEDKDSLVAVLHGKGGHFCAGWDLKALSKSDPAFVPDDPDTTDYGPIVCFMVLQEGNEWQGGHFCAGYDLKALSNADTTTLPKEPVVEDIGPMGPSRMMFTKPVIASVSGYAVAGGLELALMCDLRVVEESAVMGVFCRRFGVPLIDGGTSRLPQLIGLSRALDMILTGRPVDAREALEFGLANRVAATGAGLGAAVQLATNIARFPQRCMNTDRKSAFYSTYQATSITDALQYEFVNGVKVLEDEAVPGAQNFAKGVGRHGEFDNPKS